MCVLMVGRVGTGQLQLAMIQSVNVLIHAGRSTLEDSLKSLGHFCRASSANNLSSWPRLLQGQLFLGTKNVDSRTWAEAGWIVPAMSYQRGDDSSWRLVTCDETWVCHHKPEFLRQSMEWRYLSCLVKKKSTRPRGKVVVTVFWGMQGLITISYLLLSLLSVRPR